MQIGGMQVILPTEKCLPEDSLGKAHKTRYYLINIVK